MKKVYVFFAAVFVLGTLTFALGDSPPADEKPKWEVEGQYTEACQCYVPCSCNFGQKPTFGHCDNTSVYKIRKGRYEDVTLDGLTVVMVGSSPPGERYVDTVGNLTFARFYVDERANEMQQRALEEIARSLNASYLRLPVRKLSTDEGTKAVSIQADFGKDEAKVRIPGVLDFHTKRLIGADGKEPIEIVNGSVVIEWMPRIWAGQSKTYKYSDAREWDYSGRSAYFSSFEANSDMDSIRPSAEEKDR